MSCTFCESFYIKCFLSPGACCSCFTCLYLSRFWKSSDAPQSILPFMVRSQDSQTGWPFENPENERQLPRAYRNVLHGPVLDWYQGSGTFWGGACGAGLQSCFFPLQWFLRFIALLRISDLDNFRRRSCTCWNLLKRWNGNWHKWFRWSRWGRDSWELFLNVER